MREIGRVERTVHNLDWIEDKGLRADTTDVLNKGEARHTLSRAVAFHQLGRVRVQTGRPHLERRAFLAALIAEATNIGLGRMSEVCKVASRRTLTTISIWHMREETYRGALARVVEALHREPAAAWFGTGQVSSSDGQHFYLGGEGETGGTVNARYGRDPIIKLYTHISDRYAPFHVKVITGTSGEAIHVLAGP